MDKLKMKKGLKWGAAVFAVSAAAFIAFSFFISSKKKACLEGEGPQAIEACTFLIEGHTSGYKAECLSRRAYLLAKEGKWDQVVADQNEVVALKASAQVPPALMLSAYESLADVASRQGDAAGLEKYLELAARSGSKRPEVYLALSEIYSGEKKFQEALGLLETAGGLQAEKKHPYYNDLASAYEGLNDYGKAYDALKTALDIPAPRPVLAATAKHMGFVCYELKRYKDAEIYLGYTLKAGLDCPECALLLTTIRESLDPTAGPAVRSRRKRR